MNLASVLSFLLVMNTAAHSSELILEQQDEIVTTMNREDYTLPYFEIPLINREKYDAFLDWLDHRTYIPPRNAFLDQNGHIAAEEVGSKLYRKVFTELYYSSYYKEGSMRIQLPTLPVHPRVDKELLLHIRAKKIGDYVTYFNWGNEARSHNIVLAADSIHSHVVFPGETFSFNQVVGQRTKEKGYMRAPVIVKGELSEDIGGGICQVSSTLYNAADRAGLRIVERYSHSKSVPYVPPGRDAAVSWNGPDLSFKNEYSFPILITARVQYGQMAVTLYSSDEIDYEPRTVPSAVEKDHEEIHVSESEL